MMSILVKRKVGMVWFESPLQLLVLDVTSLVERIALRHSGRFCVLEWTRPERFLLIAGICASFMTLMRKKWVKQQHSEEDILIASISLMLNFLVLLLVKRSGLIHSNGSSSK